MPLREATHVVQTVHRLLGSGYRLAEIAVLYRTQKTGAEMQAALLSAAVPFNTHRGNVWLSKPVAGLLALLRFLLSPHDDASFAGAMEALAAPAGLAGYGIG